MHFNFETAKYKTDSASDYEKLRVEITKKLLAYLQKEQTLPKLTELLTSDGNEGLDEHEIICLAVMGENVDHPNGKVSPYQIKNDMEKSGFTKLAATLAIKSLLEKELIIDGELQEWNSEPYLAYGFADKGWLWVSRNQQKFLLKKPSPIFEDNIPF